MGTSRRVTSQAGVSTQPPLVELLVLLLTTNIVLLLGRGVVPKAGWGIHTLPSRTKVPTLLCLVRGATCQRPPGSPNRLRHLMGIKSAVGPSSSRKTTDLLAKRVR